MGEEVSIPALKAFFHRLTRRSFGDLYLADEAVVDYISGMLARFARTENLYRIKRLRGKKLETVVEMLLEAEIMERNFDIFEEREIRKHIGDYTLFMTGIFREYVERVGIMDYYLREGERSYWSVYEFDRVFLGPNPALFKELSSRFELYSGALNYMKKVYFRSEGQRGPFREVVQGLLED